jgi:hypothetical protein
MFMTFRTEFLISTANYQFNSVEELVQLIDESQDIALYAVIERARGRGLVDSVEAELVDSSHLRVIVTWPEELAFLRLLANSQFLRIKSWIDSIGWHTELVSKG